MSKAWQVIDRFSEDIDLSIDRSFYGFTEELLYPNQKAEKDFKCIRQYGDEDGLGKDPTGNGSASAGICCAGNSHSPKPKGHGRPTGIGDFIYFDFRKCGVPAQYHKSGV